MTQRRARRVRTTRQARCIRDGILAARADVAELADAGTRLPEPLLAARTYWEVYSDLARAQRRRLVRARTTAALRHLEGLQHPDIIREEHS